MDIFDQIQQEQGQTKPPDIFDQIAGERGIPLLPTPSPAPYAPPGGLMGLAGGTPEPTPADKAREERARFAFEAGDLGLTDEATAKRKRQAQAFKLKTETEKKPSEIPLTLRERAAKHTLGNLPGIAESFNTGVASIMGSLRDIDVLIRDERMAGVDPMTSALNATAKVIKPETIEKGMQFFLDNAEYWEKEHEKFKPGVIDDLVSEAVGGAVPGIGEFMLDVPYATLKGAAEAHKQGDNEAWGAIKGGAERAIIGKVFKIIGKYPKLISVPATGALFGGQAAIHGGTKEDIAKAAGTGILYGVVGGKAKEKKVKGDIKEGEILPEEPMRKEEAPPPEPPVAPEPPPGGAVMPPRQPIEVPRGIIEPPVEARPEEIAPPIEQIPTAELPAHAPGGISAEVAVRPIEYFTLDTRRNKVTPLLAGAEDYQPKAGEIKFQRNNITDVKEITALGEGVPREQAQGLMEGATLPKPGEMLEKVPVYEIPPIQVEQSFAPTPGAEKPGLLSQQGGAVELGAIGGGIPQEVATRIKNTAQLMSDTRDDFRRVFNPAARGEEAKGTARIIRQRASELAQNHDRVDYSLKEAHKALDKLPVQEGYDFITRIQKGQGQPAPELQSIADNIRTIFNKDAKDLASLPDGAFSNFLENYFPGMWKESSIKSRIFGRRPLEGPKSFTKEKYYQNIQEGIDAGLEPFYTNPVDFVLAKHFEEQRFVFAHRIKADLKEIGYVKSVPESGVPTGWSRINDKLFNNLMAPEPVAKIFNNYLSPGLQQFALYKSYRGLGNLFNQMQLGFSAFHLGFTTLDTMVSNVALGMVEASRGNIEAAIKTVAKTPIVPIRGLIEGDKIIKAWRNPDTATPETLAMVEAMKQAGGRTRMDAFYRTMITKRMMAAFKSGNFLGGILRAPFAAVEQVSRPILEYVVPRQKAGVFAEMARYEIERLNRKGASQVEITDALQKSWESVDNRLGQLVYDNLFWNKMAKDLGMASVRSLGWNLGTIREVAGGFVDVGKQVGKIARGQKPELTHRMAYTIALPLVVGMMGGTMNYLMTGQPPQELKDYYFPRTGGVDKNGNPERVSLPSYMKDIYHYGTKPIATLSAKLHPLLTTVAEMLANKDYYGTKIRNEDDPIVKQAIDLAKHTGKAMIPFSVRGQQKLAQEGAKPSAQILPFIGITPAPAELNKTPAERLMSEIKSQKISVGGRTREAFQKSRLVSDLIRRGRSEVNGGMGENINKDITAGWHQGLLNKNDIARIKREKEIPKVIADFKSLNFDEAAKVYEKMTVKERNVVELFFNKKFRHVVWNASPIQKKEIVKKWQAAKQVAEEDEEKEED